MAAAACQARMDPIHVAAATGDVQFVKSYIAKKGKLDATFDEPSRGLEGNAALLRGVTPLMMAARGGRLEIVKLLVENGANLYAEARPRDERPDWSYRRTAFDFAYENVMDRNTSGAQVLQYLWEKSDRARFAVRLDRQIHGACVRYCNDKSGSDAGTNPALALIGIAPDQPRGAGISQAVCGAQKPFEVLAFLDKHKTSYPKNTLHCAAYMYSTRSLRTLEERIAIATAFLERGADIEDPGVSGDYSPLMGAAAAHEVEMVKFLLSRGADPNRRNSYGFNAAIFAGNTCLTGGGDPDPRQDRELATIQALQQAGAQTVLGASGPAHQHARLLRECCSRQPHSATQRRICQIYGL
jgi:hypothetical protein